MLNKLKTVKAYLYFSGLLLAMTILCMICAPNAIAEDNEWEKPDNYDYATTPRNNKHMGMVYCNVENLEVYGITNPLNYKIWKSFDLSFKAPHIEKKWRYGCSQDENYKWRYHCKPKGDVPGTSALIVMVWQQTEKAKEKVCKQAISLYFPFQ